MTELTHFRYPKASDCGNENGHGHLSKSASVYHYSVPYSGSIEYLEEGPLLLELQNGISSVLPFLLFRGSSNGDK